MSTNATMQEAQDQRIAPVNYSDAEIAYRGKLTKHLENLKMQRDKVHDELDGMTYPQYYESNRKRDLSYIPPKKNKHDTRIVSGTTRDKDSTLLSSLLNLNAESTIAAFDEEDMLINELGENLAALNHKSREIEDWAKKRPIFYREMIAQGDVFVWELYKEEMEHVPLEELEWDPIKDGVSKFSFSERLKKAHGMCMAKMVPGINVYLGSTKIEYIEDQDDVAIVFVRNRSEAEGIYGQWERWKHVPYSIDGVTSLEDGGTNAYKDWNLVTTTIDQVCEIHVFNKRTNRYMILINGVMMLPINYPLTGISPTQEIPMAQGKLDPISGFAYSKSQPSGVKVDQAVIDEALMLMIEKNRQAFKPPMGNTSKRVFSSEIFHAGKITNDLRRNQLFPLLPDGSQGITSGEFSFYQLFKESINEKTVNDVFSGNDPQGDPTATEVLAQKEQQLLKLGRALDGVVNLERRMTWLRVFNIVANWTKPTDTKVDDIRNQIVDVFRKISVETTVETGEKGIKMFRFTEEQFPDRFTQAKEEDQLSKKYGKPVRIVYFNPQQLRQLKMLLFIIVNPTPKSNDKLSQLLFVQNVRTAGEIFGYESLNEEYVKQRFAIVIGEDYNKFFKDMSMMQMMQMGMERQLNDKGGAPGAPKGKQVTPGNQNKPMVPAVSV